MAKIEIASLVDKIGQETTIQGWAQSVRSHGKIIFVDLRDHSGLLQVVFWKKDLVEKASTINTEDLIEVTGTVQARPENMVNKDISTGTIEFGASNFEFISDEDQFKVTNVRCV